MAIAESQARRRENLLYSAYYIYIEANTARAGVEPFYDRAAGAVIRRGVLRIRIAVMIAEGLQRRNNGRVFRRYMGRNIHIISLLWDIIYTFKILAVPKRIHLDRMCRTEKTEPADPVAASKCSYPQRQTYPQSHDQPC